MQELLQTLTLDQARKWDAATDKFVFVDDDILEPAGLRANDARVTQVENALAKLLDLQEERERLVYDLLEATNNAYPDTSPEEAEQALAAFDEENGRFFTAQTN